MTHKKLLIAAAFAGFAALGFSANADAALPGFYVGGQLGWGHANVSNDNNGIAGRVNGGYQINQNWATELGYTRFSDINKFNDLYAVDLVAKGILPIGSSFNLYGKGGAAYVSTSSSGNTDRVYPTFGAGISYDITPNVVTDLSWNRIQKTGNGTIPSTDLFGVGIAYNFG